MAADLLPQLCITESLKYTNYVCGFRYFICDKISR